MKKKYFPPFFLLIVILVGFKSNEAETNAKKLVVSPSISYLTQEETNSNQKKDSIDIDVKNKFKGSWYSTSGNIDKNMLEFDTTKTSNAKKNQINIENQIKNVIQKMTISTTGEKDNTKEVTLLLNGTIDFSDILTNENRYIGNLDLIFKNPGFNSDSIVTSVPLNGTHLKKLTFNNQKIVFSLPKPNINDTGGTDYVLSFDFMIENNESEHAKFNVIGFNTRDISRAKIEPQDISDIIAGPDTKLDTTSLKCSVTDAAGNPIESENQTGQNKVSIDASDVDTQKQGQYNITYTYTDVFSQVFTVKKSINVLASKASIDAKDAKVPLKSEFNPQLSFVTATDAYGKRIGYDDDGISVDSSQLNTDKPGEYPVVYHYKDVAGNKFEKKITVSVEKPKMSVKQVYLGTDIPIYSNLEEKTVVDNSKQNEVEMGDKIEEVLTNLENNNSFTLNYKGYDEKNITDYKLYENNKEIIPTPTTVPDDDFTIVYEYTGQLKFDEVPAKLNFGTIEITAEISDTALTQTSNVKIINTLQNSKWTLKALVPNGIRNEKNKEFLGTLTYRNSITDKQIIGNSATIIKKQEDKNLLSQLSLKDNDVGLFLEQDPGNLKGKYTGVVVWSLEDSR